MENLLKEIELYPLVPIFYHDDIAVCIKAIDSCYKGGVRVFEFVKRGTYAYSNFQELLAYRDIHWPDLKLGIGTIKTKQDALYFLSVGADFIVSPIVSRDIAEVASEHGKCWIPGAMTPTEIALAESLGAQLIKLFPGDVLGPQFVKAIRPIFPELKFMVTGGVLLQEDNLQNWFKAGVTSVGMGSGLFRDLDYPGLEVCVATALDWMRKF
jgi:2-dehydro-3-deoxyphosphogluconate aldolase/(4S)-4-hydroxy-2-oxoglutarate aldolase